VADDDDEGHAKVNTRVTLQVNGRTHEVEVLPGEPLLWALRERLGQRGTKFGCGIGLCGACTVHVDGQPARSCVTPASAVQGRAVATIEGLAAPDGRLHPLQQAWIDLQVPQCGYCQSGMLMAAAALLKTHPQPTDQQIDAAMTNLCRCGTYPRVREAIHLAARKLASPGAAA
jgi:isoquinoline 1-oxidoreductase subunit alpha